MTVDAIIASDACPRGEDLSRFSGGDAAGVFSDLLGDFGTADLSTVNLERPLADPCATSSGAIAIVQAGNARFVMAAFAWERASTKSIDCRQSRKRELLSRITA